MKKKFGLFLILLSLGCAKKEVVLEGYEEGVWLGFKFIPGKSLSYTHSTNISTTIEAGGIPQSVDSWIKIRTTQTVEDTGEVIALKINYDDVSGTAKIGSQLRPIKELDELKGKEVLLKLSKDGEIKELKGLEDVEYFKKSGESPVEQFEEEFSFLPNKIIKIGESWIKEFKTQKVTYTLVRIEKRKEFVCARIKTKHEVETTKTEFQQGIKANVKIKGSGKGELFFDIQKGILIEQKYSLSLEGEQEVSGGMISESMSMPIYIDQEICKKLVY